MTRSAAGRVPLLLEPRFLDRHECERLRRAMDRGDDAPAEIIGEEIAAHDRVRRTRSIEIETGVSQWFERRLDRFRPAIERQLQRPLGEREGTGFLRYAPGGFYRAHRDRGEVAGWPPAARRAVSIIVFLNASRTSSRPGDFDGGVLSLYPEHDSSGIEISPEAGLLVAFPAEMLHEVHAVRDGVRDAAVDWFYDR